MTRGSIRLAGAVFAAGLLAIAGAAAAVALSPVPGAEPWISMVVALVVPVFAGLVAVRGGMRLSHVLSWAVPSSVLLLLVFLSPAHPLGLLPLSLGMGLPARPSRDLIAITQEVPRDSFDLVVPKVAAQQSPSDKSRDALYDRLIELGVPEKLGSAVHADIGDIAAGLAKIQELYVQIADGRDVSAALDIIESEARDHLSWHVKSIGKTARKLRRLRRKSKRRGDPRRPFAPLK